mgnify:CR=1 FL=1
MAKLPQLLQRKIYKTGQTRGADDDVIYQNRVNRNSTVLIPLPLFTKYGNPPQGEEDFDNGSIVLLTPEEYFTDEDITDKLESMGLEIGVNALVFYQKRVDWMQFPPLESWQIPTSRTAPLGGEYVARIAGTTAQENGDPIRLGYTETGLKGAGIRLYEYSSRETIALCRSQLELLYWLCFDSLEAAEEFAMLKEEAESRREECKKKAESKELSNYELMKKQRMVNEEGFTICPLCMEPLSARGFYARMAQAEGREVHDLTVTEVNLFHINEVKYGDYNHKPYNLGWGHHHCNVVVKDSGIEETLDWMAEVLKRNKKLEE